MRVGLFAHRLSQREPTGVGRYVSELVGALAKLDRGEARFVVASTPERGSAGWVPSPVETQVLPWPRRQVQAAWCLGVGPALERRLGKLDVVHLMQPFPPVRTVAPQLVTVHDLFPLEHRDWYRRSERWSYQRSMDLILRRAKRIVVPSAYVARRLVELLAVAPERVEDVPLGVSGRFAGARSREAIEAACNRFGVSPGRYAVSVGAVSTRKNLLPLVKAFLHLPQDAALPLLMIGPDGHGAEIVDAEIASLDGRASIQRTGFLPDSETAALVAGAAVVLHPALGEGFGFVPLEAMAVGTPVIAAAVGSIPEVAGDAAVLLDAPTDPRAWAQALSELLADPARMRRLSLAGERRVAEFTWGRTAQRLLDIYVRVADS